MATVFVLDVPENRPVVQVAERDARVRVDRNGPYFEVSSDGPIEIDRRATGCRHAVWYSCVAGLAGFRIAGWDKNSLRLEPRA
ncbi:hypothetical protein [Actinomadura bangladeshensis]|uniref:Uncharacterized protein n=1 Tax=Actinomadura bangladeshensis TaxID=453573 RepID=A0A4R4P9F1_9ACTN|nr:hypothetical protein [Actinomadura bangladeshensis]TDC17610.1 hypothetical protein E1284_08505 [Actinomadura bangladeshensis]